MTPQLTNAEVAKGLIQRALEALEQGEAEILIQAARRLDPTIDAEAITQTWREQWVEEYGNRSGMYLDDPNDDITRNVREAAPQYDPEAKARALIAQQTLAELIDTWELSERKRMEPALPIARGWLMDELEKRNPEAFDEWLESGKASPRQFFLNDEERSTYTQEYDDFTDADPGL